MNSTSPTSQDSRSEDNLDRLLSGYFKSKLKQPWPAAPTTSSLLSEPSVLVASRSGTNTVETPRNQPSSRADVSHKSRYTLAASVAVLLGTCWLLSNGFQSGGERGVPAGITPAGLKVLPDTEASNPPVLKENKKTKAEEGNQVGPGMKIQLP